MTMNASMEEEQRNDRIVVEGCADIRRDPSFSRWYDEDDAEKLNLLPLHLQKIREEVGFRLPLPEEDEQEERGGECAIGIDPLSDYRDVDNLNCLTGEGDDRNGGLHSPMRSSSLNENGEKFLCLDLESENHSRTSSPRQRIPSPRQTKYSGFEVENGDDSKDATVDATQSKYSPVPFGTVIRTLILIVVWYFFSTCLTLYNKSLLGDHLGKFPAPLLMNTVHFALQAILSHLILICGGGRSHKSQPNAIMSWRDYFLRVVPTALGTALDINLSNASLVFISVTFATMCKSAGPIFLLLFAFGFKLETPSVKLLGIMLVISAGVLLTVSKETQFELWGFLFVMLAAVMSGFRWSMTQILLQREVYGLKNPITLMSYVTPVMALATFLLSLVFDPWKDFNQSNYFNDPGSVLHSSFLMIIGGALAFCMVLTEYVLVSATSAVTVTIAGIMKEAVTIVVAVFYFHDEFTVLKGVGLIIIMVGVGLFNWYKYQKLQNEHLTESSEYKVIPNGAAKYVILDNMDDLDAKI